MTEPKPAGFYLIRASTGEVTHCATLADAAKATAAHDDIALSLDSLPSDAPTVIVIDLSKLGDEGPIAIQQGRVPPISVDCTITMVGSGMAGMTFSPPGYSGRTTRLGGARWTGKPPRSAR